MHVFDEQTAEKLWETLKDKDEFTAEHCRRVSREIGKFAQAMGIPNMERKWYRIGGLLHDIGKICLADSIFEKIRNNCPIDLEEKEEIRRHVNQLEILKNYIDVPETVLNMIKYHHERFNGKGYPEGLVGQKIPLEARMLSIADYYDTILVQRSHKVPIGMEPLNREDAIRIMIENAYERFDPDLITIFIREVIFAPEEDYKDSGEIEVAPSSPA